MSTSLYIIKIVLSSILIAVILLLFFVIASKTPRSESDFYFQIENRNVDQSQSIFDKSTLKNLRIEDQYFNIIDKENSHFLFPLSNGSSIIILQSKNDCLMSKCKTFVFRDSNNNIDFILMTFSEKISDGADLFIFKQKQYKSKFSCLISYNNFCIEFEDKK